MKSTDRDETLKEQDWTLNKAEKTQSEQDESTNSDSTKSSKSSVEYRISPCRTI